MESKQDINDFEQALRTDLHQYLLSLDKVDERLPEAPDIEELWSKIGESYLPDGMEDPGLYQPVPRGLEIKIGEKLAHLRELDRDALKVAASARGTRNQETFKD